MPNNRNLKDALLKVSKALPASTSAVSTTAIDLMVSGHGDFVAHVQLHLSAPALTTAQLPDAKTMTYTVEADTDPAFSSPTPTTITAPVVQTGAGGAGAVGSDWYFSAPINVGRYVRATATPAVTGTGDASATVMYLEILA